MYENKCNRCEKSFGKYMSLSRHMKLKHGVTIDQSYVEYHLGGVWPLCKCGCNEKVKWSAMLKKFCDYCHGHQSRIHNNWGHNQAAIDKSTQTRRKQFENGERNVWNNGLSAEMEKQFRKRLHKIERINILV